MSQIVLALDVATVVGFAVGAIDKAPPPTALEASSQGGVSQPLSGSQRIGHQRMDAGAFFASYERWLRDMIGVHTPDIIVFEAPFISGGKQMNAAIRLLGMAAVTELVAHHLGVRIFSAHMSKVRKHFCGTGHAKRDIIKKKIQDACDARGWFYADDNAADALAVWDYTAACLTGRAKE